VNRRSETGAESHDGAGVLWDVGLIKRDDHSAAACGKSTNQLQLFDELTTGKTQCRIRQHWTIRDNDVIRSPRTGAGHAPRAYRPEADHALRRLVWINAR